MREQIENLVAAMLWETHAFKVAADEPFTLASGNRSPIYVDTRVLISYPWTRGFVSAAAQWRCESQGIVVDCVAGGETAGIPFAAWLAERMGKPYVYVRKEAKKYGAGGQVVGHLPSGARVLLYEDLITDGGSKLAFVNGIHEAGGSVTDCLVVFDREQAGREQLLSVGVRLHALCNLTACLAFGAATGLLAAEPSAAIKAYLADPAAWHAARGYAYNAPAK